MRHRIGQLASAQMLALTMTCAALLACGTARVGGARDVPATPPAADAAQDARTDGPERDGTGADAPSADTVSCPATACRIAGRCEGRGAVSPDDPCAVCAPDADPTGWTDLGSGACQSGGYWAGVRRAVARTAAGHHAAVSCHNCYLDSATTEMNLAVSLSMLHAAQADGADLLELDVKQEDGVIYVDHNDDGETNGALLTDLLADGALREGDQLLFIELKESTPTPSFVGALLDTLAASGLARPGRPIVLRAFDGERREALALAQRLLAEPERAELASLVRLHVLFRQDDVADAAALHAALRAVADDGYDGVEFQYQDAHLLTGIAFAHELGLAVNVWTLPLLEGEVHVATLRELSDMLTVDYPVSRARAIVEAQDSVLLCDVTRQRGDSVLCSADGAEQAPVPLDEPEQPALDVWDEGRTLFGGALRFDADEGDSLSFPIPSSSPDGWLITAGVAFDRTTLPARERATLLHLVGPAPALLELTNDGDGTVLRFSTNDGNETKGIALPTDGLDPTRAYLLTATVDATRGPRLWLNATPAGAAAPAAELPPAPLSEVLLGAAHDPTDGTTQHLAGTIQFIQVLRWSDAR